MRGYSRRLINPSKVELKEKNDEILRLTEELRKSDYNEKLYFDQMQAEAKRSYELQQLIEHKDKEIEDLKAGLNTPACDVKVLESPESQLPPLIIKSLIPASTPSLPVPSFETTSKQSLPTEIRTRERSPEISDPMLVSDDSEYYDPDEEPDVEFAPTQSRKPKYKTKTTANATKLMNIAFARLESWKCEICSSFFKTDEALRLHITDNHRGRKICQRCPKTKYCRPNELAKHEQRHFRNDLKKSEPNMRECQLCNVWLFGNGRLVSHIYQFHMPREAK